MLAHDIIRTKRERGALDRAQIDAFVAGLVDGSWSDAQAAALAMAVCLNGMDGAETVALTDAMTRSGSVLDWRADTLGGPVLDKHSTGGVGDKVSLVLAPLVAAAGGFVPMVSGRGLGHTGGTLDKLAAIPGYTVDAPLPLLRQALAAAGCAIVGATAALAPADRRLYAVRDATATVESLPLIVASILSKKRAAGVDALVVDVKTGNGAFAADRDQARALARALVEVGSGAGLAVRAWISDMNQVLGSSCGNAVEVHEALDLLQGRRKEPRLLEVVRTLGVELLLLGGLADEPEAAAIRIDTLLANGAALERFGRMVAALGGPADFVERADAYLPAAPVQRAFVAARSGWVGALDTRAIGQLVVELGGGRRQAGAAIDPRVGLTEVACLGLRVEAGDRLAVVHAADATSAARACERLAAAFGLAETAPPPAPVMLERIGSERRPAPGVFEGVDSSGGLAAGLAAGSSAGSSAGVSSGPS